RRTGERSDEEGGTPLQSPSVTPSDTVRGAERIPRRKALLTPDWDYNAPPELAARVRKSELSPWALFWADGDRNLFQIRQVLGCEYGRAVKLEQVEEFFEAHTEL